MSRQRLLEIVAVSLVVLCLLALLMANWLARMPGSDAPSEELSGETSDVAVIESNAEIELPLSAANAKGYITGFREIETFVRFEADAVELQSFLGSTLCDADLVPTNAPATSETPAIPWWDLGEAQDLMVCSGGRSDFGQRIWVSPLAPGRVVIYVLAWTT